MSEEIKIVYDNIATEPYESGWGFAAYLDLEEKILFDTGYDGRILLNNIGLMDIDLAQVEKIFLSHPHWDHYGGLTAALEETKNPEVYLPASFSSNLRKEISEEAQVKVIPRHQEVDIEKNEQDKRKLLRVSKNTFSTGELGKVGEQALVIEHGGVKYMITGCGHPGLDQLIKVAEEIDNKKLTGVIGGFHDFSKIKALNELETIVPCHCTQRKQEIRKLYPSKTEECKVGTKISLKK
ncbi:MAG: Metal-dependent hydrolase of the beta-lactamase superfamily II [Candidatus Methanohalarchaeum thermophilum]|uniref:Metal-dependent hydrolase of the beta-lactamase superfamily II n=1 Tax=Methanohalarchaeum thermophilum TaxID=1903181 RepID=A0A1Q6DSJ2_METT1|nr:MAG: Metal-dependent hydrolase of the beta-lactamase superfamily II [Candidatus Methanohalarchaeum thermophilum]